jgi:hypothetical protein
VAIESESELFRDGIEYNIARYGRIQDFGDIYNRFKECEEEALRGWN